MMLNKYSQSSFWTPTLKVPVARPYNPTYSPLLGRAIALKRVPSSLQVFIGEYHSVHGSMEEDLTEAVQKLGPARIGATGAPGAQLLANLRLAKSPRYPYFMGYSFFEFSRSYWKGGPEMEFGMFGALVCQ